MVRVVDWCADNKRRYAEPYGVFHAVRHAWAAGYVPELDAVQRVDEDLERRISAALAVETDAEWRRRLLISSGSMRKFVYDSWAQSTLQGS